MKIYEQFLCFLSKTIYCYRKRYFLGALFCVLMWLCDILIWKWGGHYFNIMMVGQEGGGITPTHPPSLTLLHC